ncbi:hypothetical protein M409DRAFT_26364 [Zasmidium cellare ATCC 36951]|uniref:Transcription factor domain-containing protein n=1 Tax=Zasmidium cellare ATCC 36951 TaxID=1080233 RepID=A0A6A6C820_ZASCE|nr:uncharacterized protein M409DRAFT_26364 [Zasmidium cellare ATCC 36951]KAF2163327.1 hypothetical protein M409DRAFT_26364 [Zasmidium cellare ATCC 36951]
MALEIPFKFIDVTRLDNEESVKYEVRAQAALHGYYACAKRLQAVADASTGPQAIRRAGKGKNKRQANSTDKSDDRPRDKTGFIPVESTLLTPYSQPPELRDQDWIDCILNTYFNFIMPPNWLACDMDAKVGFPAGTFVNWYEMPLYTESTYPGKQLTADFCRFGRDSLQKFLWLKGHLLRQINMVIADPQRRLDSLAILAVLHMACYEVFAGNFCVATEVHIPGLRRLLALQGGEQELEKKVPAFVMGTRRWLSDVLTRSCGCQPVISPLGVDIGDVAGQMKTAFDDKLGMEIYGER